MIGNGALLRAALGGAISGVAGQFGVPTARVPDLAETLAQKIAADPKVQNALNQEPLHQSGVVWGSSLGAVGSVAMLIIAYLVGPENVPSEMLYPAVIAFLGSLFALIRRIGNFAPFTLFGLLKKKA